MTKVLTFVLFLSCTLVCVGQDGVLIFHTGEGYTRNVVQPILLTTDVDVWADSSVRKLDTRLRYYRFKLKPIKFKDSSLDSLQTQVLINLPDDDNDKSFIYYGSIKVLFISGGDVIEEIQYKGKKESLFLLENISSSSVAKGSGGFLNSINEMVFQINNPIERVEVVIPCSNISNQIFSFNKFLNDSNRLKRENIPLHLSAQQENLIDLYFNEFQKSNFVHQSGVFLIDSVYWFQYEFKADTEGLNSYFCIPSNVDVSCKLLANFKLYNELKPLTKSDIALILPNTTILEYKFILNGMMFGPVWSIVVKDNSTNNVETYEFDLFTGEDKTVRITYR